MMHGSPGVEYLPACMVLELGRGGLVAAGLLRRYGGSASSDCASSSHVGIPFHGVISYSPRYLREMRSNI
jgi:hypothetical protein